MKNEPEDLFKVTAGRHNITECRVGFIFEIYQFEHHSRSIVLSVLCILNETPHEVS